MYYELQYPGYGYSGIRAGGLLFNAVGGALRQEKFDWDMSSVPDIDAGLGGATGGKSGDVAPLTAPGGGHVQILPVFGVENEGTGAPPPGPQPWVAPGQERRNDDPCAFS